MRYSIHLFLVVLLAALFVVGCKEPDGIGLDVLPGNEEMGLTWVDTFTVKAQTVTFDSVRTSGRGTYIVGDFGDPIFGRVRSQLFTQFRLPAEPTDFGSNPQLDSIILNLAYSGSYGRIDKLKGTHHFGVYEIGEDLYADSTYYSDDVAQIVSSSPLAEIQFKPDLLNTVPTVFDSVPLFPSFRVRLDDAFGQRILNSPHLSSNADFLSEFKGFNLQSLSSQMPTDYGSLLYFNLASDDSRIEIYYSNSEEDSLHKELLLDNNNAVFTNAGHDFSTDVQYAVFGGTVTGGQKLYLQSYAGTRIRADFPHLRELNNFGYVAINKAELVLPVDEGSMDEFGLPVLLQVASINEYDSAFQIVDVYGEVSAGVNYYGGIYDSDKKEYVFNIARYLQGILNHPEREYYGIYITPVVVIDGTRAVLNGPEHPDNPMKLRMTYTLID
ncbi:MAG: DUF4270 domain-containing protein [Flavobacteriales bacterium]|nr:DUF4270 domain-containing protein [Flavobacteriales bacterium]